MGTEAWCTRLLAASVTQGVAEVALKLLKEKPWVTGAALVLITTMTNFPGAPELSL